MPKVLVSLMFLSCLCVGQVTPSAPAPGSPKTPTPSTADVPPTAAVITLPGFCPDAPKGTDPKSPACKTVVTKAAFEKLIDTLNPKMPPPARQSVANEYAKMLVLSDEAKKQGLTETQHYKDLLTFLKMQVAAQELLRHVQEETKPTPAEVEAFYKADTAKYEEISLKRIFIPRNSPTAKPDDKKPTNEELMAEGEKARAQLAAGADFDKVQKDIYEQRGYKTPPPPTTIPNWRRESIPPQQAALFDLKQGEFSPVMVEPAGAYIYRVESKSTVPLDQVRAEIESQLASQRMRAKMDELTQSIKPELNQAYFGTLGLQAPGPMRPVGAQAPSRGVSATTKPAAQQATPPATSPATPKQ
ncbi:MAG TPA: peptidylprolyl isomerase [Terriglobales bacterium]|nr:peptidylprolyl isomerase [Terriglobales bacterium]